MRFGARPGGLRLSTAVLAALIATGLDACQTSGQSGGTSSAATTERFIGAWDLIEWRVTDGSGNVRYPYGEDARGQVTYSVDGRMSAHLMRPPSDPADAPPQYLSYWGTFSVDARARTVTHHVMGSDQANWIGSDQVRGFAFDGGDRLILSLGSNRLTWVRVR
jgi:hypothetical protein